MATNCFYAWGFLNRIEVRTTSGKSGMARLVIEDFQNSAFVSMPTIMGLDSPLYEAWKDVPKGSEVFIPVVLVNGKEGSKFLNVNARPSTVTVKVAGKGKLPVVDWPVYDKDDSSAPNHNANSTMNDNSTDDTPV